MTPTGRVVLDNGCQYRLLTDGKLSAVNGKTKPHSLVPETSELRAAYNLQQNYRSAISRLKAVTNGVISTFEVFNATQEKVDIINKCIEELEKVK